MYSLLLTFLALLRLSVAAVVPLAIDGALDSATADSAAFNTGGKISVNGLTITVPQNLQFQFPAAFVPFKKIATDSQFIGSEVSVQGNYVDGVPIAGLIQIGQFLLEANNGVIKSLGFDGTITLESGQVVRINDPNAVFSAGYTLRPEWTADDQNPSVTAFSGFPMCVPRSANDAKCPSSNRLPATGGTIDFVAPDPDTMSPMQVGDYIEFNGIKVGTEIIAYTLLVSSVQIRTTGVAPYFRIEEAIIGVVDNQDPDLAETAETRYIGYASDFSAGQPQILERIINPCDGTVTTPPVPGLTVRFRADDPRIKFEFRSDRTTATTYSRDYLIKSLRPSRPTNGGQITAGEYIQPIGEWIFPEQAIGGIIPGAFDFSKIGSIAQGVGPDADGNIFGQLSPWPGATPPPPANCATPPTDPPTVPPEVDLGPAQTVRPGAAVVLNAQIANQNTFPSGDLTFAWRQTAGPTVQITDPTAQTASFTAGSVTAVTTFEFSVTVSSKSVPPLSTTKTLRVTNDPNAADVVAIDSFDWQSSQSGTLNVVAHSNVVDGSVRLQIFLNTQGTGAALDMVPQGNGAFTFNQRRINRPNGGITVKSNFNGQAVKTNAVVATSSRRRVRQMVLKE